MNENPTNADEQCELGDKYYYGIIDGFLALKFSVF